MEYGHGGDIYSQEIRLDFSANINPLGLPNGVKAALKEGIPLCANYPDSQCRTLTAALSDYHHLPKEWIICSNGAADLIVQLAFGYKPDKALLVAPSFSEYGNALSAAGCEIQYFELQKERGFALEVNRFCSFLEKNSTGKTMVFLCNPNNPTGLVLDNWDVLRIAEVCKDKGIFLAVDECFCDFLDRPETCSIIPWLGDFPNVMVIKAFTKLYGMAGLRLGYGLCSNREILESIQKVRQPWSVSVLAQEAGIAALKEQHYVEKTRKLIRCEKEYLKKGLEALGFLVWDSRANYLFFQDVNQEPKKLYEQMLAEGILIRCCENYGGLNGNYYRICVRTREENKQFLQSVRAVIGE